MMHIDINSCFASIEQQANPLLRGRPVAVAAYATNSGCILASSVEAKRLGIKTGMRVREGKIFCPELIVLAPDPWKYRYIHNCLRKLISQYTSNVVPKSIDEFVLDFEGYPGLKKGLPETGREIKKRLKEEIGDWLTVSIGIGPNRFLAKVASNLKKPDGLEEISAVNYREIYSKLKLTDLYGIKRANAIRLNNAGIYTVNDFFEANDRTLRSAFGSITGYYWYLRLRGWEIDGTDFSRKSYGNMYSLPTNLSTAEQLAPILHKLVEKCSFRMRKAGRAARGVHVGILYKDRSFWHKGAVGRRILFGANEIYRQAYQILAKSACCRPVATLSVTLFDLKKADFSQLQLFEEISKKVELIRAIDKINERWGEFSIVPAKMMGTEANVPDAVAFGNIKEL